jgi:3-keto-5-aminohexanoate cleavage enzyme
MTKTWLEAALNGPWQRKNQPNIPITVDEVIAEGIAAAKAGAAIVHIHAYDPDTGVQNDSPEIYAAIIEGIHAKVDAIVYPTISSATQPGSEVGVVGAWRYEPGEVLGARGMLEWSIVDPGSANLAAFADIAADKVGYVYMNVESDIRAGFAAAEKHGYHASMALYEPGFVRLGAALAARYPRLKTPIYRFCFSEGYSFGFPLREYALEAYLSLLDECAPGAPWMVSGLKCDTTPLIPMIVARGGQVRTGLEDVEHGCPLRNIDLVEATVKAVERAGGNLATAAEVRAALAKIDATRSYTGFDARMASRGT